MSDDVANRSVDSPRRISPDRPFLTVMAVLGGGYVLMIVAMLVADASYTTPGHLWRALDSPDIRYSIKLSIVSCGITTILSLWVAVPIGYLMSRLDFRGKNLLDAVLDIPIVLPPLVIGLSLLILFNTAPGRAVEHGFEWLSRNVSWWPWPGVTYEVPSVILAQFMVACAFAVRTLRVTFDQISPRCEQVALTLGCHRSRAFWMVVVPEARRGILTAGTLAWARALGEFGPILVFSGATRGRTEVLSTTVFLELSVGDLEAAVAVSLIMVMAAVTVLIIARSFGMRQPPLL